MNRSLRRGIADLACRVLQAALPPSLQSWGQAIRCETADIPDDTEALRYALESFCGLMPRALAWHLLRPFASLTGDGPPFHGDPIMMNLFHATLRRPRVTGVASAIGAVALGLVYMALAGAPMRYLGINASALLLGLALLALLGRSLPGGRRLTTAALVAMAGALLATALLGHSVDGAARWVRLGGFSIQPSLILLPAMLVAFARCRNALTTVGMVAAAMALAGQPDRAMAGMLAVGLAVLAIMRRDRFVVAALCASIAGFVATVVRADTLMAVPYVDGILYSSFEVHALAGAAVMGGSLLLLAPAIVGWHRDSPNRESHAVFGALWLAAIVAAALGNYPTPLVGYGSSAIIGFALSLLALPTLEGAHDTASTRACSEADTTPPDQHLLTGLA
ncbi:FtsW/RodA/SpoVE family cell cycle protein [Telluria beijingensis]|uniref:FtsW/RodA/SpoVE family cell cycle protein n=1 Tax=Telluria beijingensis TaxID=3068633 RepID=UPI0027962218|nr:FtsW/RodA/SpoVE family cell cycle protein [Massilia sp. REN29]